MSDARLNIEPAAMAAALMSAAVPFPELTTSTGIGVNPFDAAHGANGQEHAGVCVTTAATIRSHAAGLAAAGLLGVAALESMNAANAGRLAQW